MGNDHIEGHIGDNGRGNAVGKGIQQVSIYSDTPSWRDAVKRDLEHLSDDHNRQGTFIMFLMVACCVLYLIGFVLSALIIRQFDMLQYQLDRRDTQIERRFERMEDRIPTPTPQPWPWPEDADMR